MPGRSSTDFNIVNSSVVLRIYPSDGCQPMHLIATGGLRGGDISLKVIACYVSSQ